MPKKGEKKLHPVNCDHWCITLGPDSEHFPKISRDEFNAMWFFMKSTIFNFVKMPQTTQLSRHINLHGSCKYGGSFFSAN